MLTAQHEEAEVLRHARLEAYAPHHGDRPSLRWLFELLGWRALRKDRAALRAG